MAGIAQRFAQGGDVAIDCCLGLIVKSRASWPTLSCEPPKILGAFGCWVSLVFHWW